jgi:hypothetical protein
MITPAPHLAPIAPRPFPILADSMVQFFHAVYGVQTGYVEVCYIAGDPRTGVLRRSRWMWYAPDRAQAIADHCADLVARYGDVYVSRVCYATAQRRKEQARPSWAIFVDDAPADALFTFLVHTSRERCHGWLILDRPVDSVTNELISRRAAYALNGADHGGWDITQLVRVPASLNTKGGGQYHVHAATTSQQRFSVQALLDRFPALPAVPQHEDQIIWDVVERIYSQRAQILTPQGLPRRVKNPHAQLVRLLRGPVWDDTSAQRWAIAKGLLIHGYPNEEIAALLIHFTNYDKIAHKGSAWLYEDIARVVTKLRAKYPEVQPVPSARVAEEPVTPLPQTPPRARGRQRGMDVSAYVAWLCDHIDASNTILRSQQEIAADLRISVSTVQRLERTLRACGQAIRRVSSNRQLSYITLLGPVTNTKRLVATSLFDGTEFPIPMPESHGAIDMEHTPVPDTYFLADLRAAPVSPAPPEPASARDTATVQEALRRALPRQHWPLINQIEIAATATATLLVCPRAADMAVVQAHMVPVVRAFLRANGYDVTVRLCVAAARQLPRDAMLAPPVAPSRLSVSGPVPAPVVGTADAPEPASRPAVPPPGGTAGAHISAVALASTADSPPPVPASRKHPDQVGLLGASPPLGDPVGDRWSWGLSPWRRFGRRDTSSMRAAKQPCDDNVVLSPPRDPF